MTPQSLVVLCRKVPAAPHFPGTHVFSVRVDDVGPQEALNRIAARDPEAGFAYVLAPKADGLVALERRPELRKAYKGAWLSLCGGGDFRRLAQRRGIALKTATAEDLTRLLFERVITPDTAVTVIGSAPETVRRLRAQFGLTRLAHFSPPSGFVRDAITAEACFQFVQDNPARFVLICLASPWQELLAARIAADGHATGLGLCIGPALDDIAGVKGRLPAWMRFAQWKLLRRMAMMRMSDGGSPWPKRLLQRR